MFEPVTMTRSISATGAAGAVSWANVLEPSSKPVVAIAHPTHQMNGRLITAPFDNLASFCPLFVIVRVIRVFRGTSLGRAFGNRDRHATGPRSDRALKVPGW